QAFIGVNEQVLERGHRLGAGLDCGVVGDLEQSNGLNRAVGGFRGGGGEPGEGSPVSPSEAEALAEATDRNSTGPQNETSGDDFTYDPEGWNHPESSTPEKQEG